MLFQLWPQDEDGGPGRPVLVACGDADAAWAIAHALLQRHRSVEIWSRRRLIGIAQRPAC